MPFCVLLLAFFQVTIAIAQVQFEKTKDLNEILAKAKNENKLVFIDGYTNWCGWCKVLDEKVFCAGNVADTMNKYFVSAKFEMEKDSFGVLLARKYAVMGFPTALILNKDGALINVLNGYSEPQDYLKRLNPIITAGPFQSPIPGYSPNLSPAFPDFYVAAFPMNGSKRSFPDSATVNQFLASRVSIKDEISWNVINRFYFMLNPKQQDRILANATDLKQDFGTDLVQGLLNNLLSTKIGKAIEQHDEKTFNETLKQASVYLEDPNVFVFNSKVERFKSDSNWKEMSVFIQQSIPDTTLGLSPNLLNEYAWTIYLNADDPTAIKTAILWMENIVLKKDPQYAYYDTYASLFYKAKDYTKAKKAAVRAIEIGKANKEDVSETEKLLRKIELAQKK